MADASEPPTEDPEQNVVLTSKQLRMLAQHIASRQSLLDLPEAEFRLLIPYHGESIGREMADELRDYLDEIGEDEDPRCRYPPGTFPSYAIRDIETVLTLPGGAIAALPLLPRLCLRALEDDQWQEDEYWFLHNAEHIDKLSMSTLRQIKTELPEACVDGTLNSCFLSLRQERARWMTYCENVQQAEEEEKGRWPYPQHPFPVFRKSLQSMRAWHSRDVGLMLAMRVAGEVLPPELVELIGECFYDAEALKLLDEALAGESEDQEQGADGEEDQVE